MKVYYYVRIYYNHDDGVYYVGIPGFPPGVSPECVTFGETLEHAREMAKECIELMLEGYLQDGDPIPTQDGMNTSGLEAIRIDESLAFVLWLREQREQRKLSQAQAASLLGMSTKNYQRLENPKRCNPTLRTAVKIREGFGLEELIL
ncbi:MAG: type II toxin-antitoxin system HicB family antitoxin [Spirochaetota bacterium]